MSSIVKVFSMIFQNEHEFIGNSFSLILDYKRITLDYKRITQFIDNSQPHNFNKIQTRL